MFIERILEHKASQIKAYPCHSNRASEIGHPCLRYLTYCRTHWEQKSLPDVRLKLIFDMGNFIEDVAIRELKEAGVTIHSQQRPFEMKDIQLTGSVDGFIINDGKEYPFDIKSCSPYVFKTINTIYDLKESKYVHLRKYPYQLSAYLMLGGTERGLLIFKEKVSGAYKEVWLDFDWDMADEIVKKCQAINKFVANNDLPDRIDFSEKICGECNFRHICLPDTVGKEVEIDTGELEELLKTRDRLDPMAREYDEVNDEINRIVIGREKILAGDYFVTGKWIEPKNRPKYWKKSIVKI